MYQSASRVCTGYRQCVYRGTPPDKVLGDPQRIYPGTPRVCTHLHREYQHVPRFFQNVYRVPPEGVLGYPQRTYPGIPRGYIPEQTKTRESRDDTPGYP